MLWYRKKLEQWRPRRGRFRVSIACHGTDRAKILTLHRYQRAKIAFEAEENPTLESQIRFKKAQEKEHLRTTRIRLREALSQSENDISHPYSHSEDIENPGIQASEDIEEQNTGQEGTFDLFCSDDEAAPIQDLANHSIFNNEAILSVCTKEDAPKPKKVAKAKSGTRQDELSKKGGEASNDKTKKAKQKVKGIPKLHFSNSDYSNHDQSAVTPEYKNQKLVLNPRKESPKIRNPLG